MRDWGGHVPADDVAVDQREMTGLQVGRDAILLVEQRQVVRRHDGDLEAVDPEMIGIALAAAALRVLVERNLPVGAGRAGRGRYDRYGTAGEQPEQRAAVEGRPRRSWLASIRRVIS